MERSRSAPCATSPAGPRASSRVCASCSRAAPLSTARALTKDAKRDALADELGLGRLDEDDLYAALDWLRARQAKIERRLARRHLEEGSLVLYDLSSTYLEGRRCPLARHGYSRDRKRGKLQIEFGLLCDREGRPLAVEVFEGNAADPSTVAPQIEKLQRFGLKRLVLVGDRGMLTEARIREDVRPSGMDWVSALRTVDLRRLAPLLFQDDDCAAAGRERGGPVEKSRVSPSARAKAATKRTPDGLPVQSLESLLETLSALMLSRSYLPAAPEVEFWMVSEATRLQARAFELLDISPSRTVPISRPG